jgi:hypothetical protein
LAARLIFRVKSGKLVEKAHLRNIAIAATEQHLERLRDGRPETIETTSLHLDVLRDLRRIHSHICSVAYPVLEGAGELPALQNAEAVWPPARCRPPDVATSVVSEHVAAFSDRASSTPCRDS